jgi:hypothetical protein
MSNEMKIFKCLSADDLNLASKETQRINEENAIYGLITNVRKKNFKKFVKIISCEDFDRKPTTFIYDQMMKIRKKWVFLFNFTFNFYKFYLLRETLFAGNY